MKELAIAYINGRIRQNLSSESFSSASIDQQMFGKSHADIAKDTAQQGDTILTATHLFQDDTLLTSQKGEILAEAYTKQAERNVRIAESVTTPLLIETYNRE